MIFIIDGKKYDTEKSEMMYETTTTSFFGAGKVFKTKKGNYFEVYSTLGIVTDVRLVSEKEVKEFIKSRDWKRYEELFGEIEEG